jgi:hypothetical protein
MSMVATFLLLLLSVTGCSTASSRPLPRLERYDFAGQTPADLVGLRQIAPAEGPEGALARYALARAHADWLVLGLVDDQENGTVLRRLAADLDVAGASIDDPLTLPQVLDCIDRVLVEVDESAGAGGEARSWSRAVTRLLRGVREGWEPFGPELFGAVHEAGSEEGPARLAADLLALGWAGVALDAAGNRPEPERAAFLLRMAGFADPELVETLTDSEGGGLWDAGVGPSCPEVERQIESSTPLLDRLATVRATCSGAAYGFPREVGQTLSPELVAAALVLRDLAERRGRVDADAGADDPLRLAAEPALGVFDRAFAALRLPRPLPVPGPRTPAVPVLEGEGSWRSTAAVVTVGSGRDDSGPRQLSLGLWPVLATTESGELRLLDRVAGLEVPGRPVGPGAEELRAALEDLFAATRDRLGLRVPERSVAILVDGAADVASLEEVLGRLEGAGVSSIDLIAQTPGDGGGVTVDSISLDLDRGAAQGRVSADRRALVVLGPDGIQVGTADGHWAELQRDGDELPETRIHEVMAAHLAGRGSAECILSVRDGVAVQRVAQALKMLARLPGPEEPRASTGQEVWRVRLDPAAPTGPRPVADTAAGAVARHRVRLRSCYERYLSSGGEAHGALVLEVAVNPGGEVGEVRVVESELGPVPSLDSCLVGEAQQIRFPPSPDGQTIRVPLRFIPQ